MWLSVTTEDDESLRLGINPMGAYDVKMFNANGEVGQGFKLEEVQCSLGYGASWNCQVRSCQQDTFQSWMDKPYSIAPNSYKTRAYEYFSPLSSLCLGIYSRPPYPTLPSSKPSTSTAWPLSWTEGENLPLIFKKRSNCTPGFSSAYFSPSRLDFVGATCPGFDPEADIDWKGCSSDVR